MSRAVDTPSLRKARGAFFTPPDICRFIVEWAVRSPADRVLEPSCGEAAFLLAAGDHIRSQGWTRESGLHGVELHDASARQARRLLRSAGIKASILCSDFFAFDRPGAFDAVVGNPPYVRYQDFTGSSREAALRAAEAEGVHLTRLASSWAAFTVHTARCVRPDGRLGLVLPAELLTANYAAAVRAFLLRRFESVRLVFFRERVFPGVSEEVVLLLAEGKGPAPYIEVAEVADLCVLNDTTAANLPWRRSVLNAADRWLVALLDPDAVELLHRLGDSAGLLPLAEWGDPTLGMVTGSNDFFALADSDVRARRIAAHEVERISPPGSRHLRRLSFDDADWERLKDEGARVWLFRPKPGQRLSKGARDYIADGEDLEVHEAYKCRVREPWWRVPDVPTADLLLTYMNHDAPRLVANYARARHLNSVHGIRLRTDMRDVGMSLLPIGVLNSASLLSAEVVGRAYGGGLLKLEPREAERMLVPSPLALCDARERLRAVRGDVAQRLAAGRLDDAVGLVDDVVLCGAYGLAVSDVERLRDARRLLVSRRSARS